MSSAVICFAACSSRITHFGKHTGTKFEVCRTDMILGNSWSFSGHQFSLSSKLESSSHPALKFGLFFSCMILQMIVASGALCSCSSLFLIPLAFPWGRVSREGHAPVSFVPRVSDFGAVLFICIMTGYMFPGTSTKKTLPCSAVKTARKPSFKAN